MSPSAAAAIFVCLALSAQLPDSEHISVASSASVRVMPDMATIEATIAADDMDATKAKAVVDERSAKVIEFVKRLGVANFEPALMEISAEIHAVFRIKPGKQVRAVVGDLAPAGLCPDLRRARKETGPRGRFSPEGRGRCECILGLDGLRDAIAAGHPAGMGMADGQGQGVGGIVTQVVHLDAEELRH